MHGFQVISKWFGQKIEGRYFSRPHRRFDQEKNSKLYAELHAKVEDLGAALQMGIGETEAAAEVGMLATMIAFNVEKGFGGESEEPAPAATPDVTVPVDEAQTAAPATKPKVKPGSKKRT